MLSPHALCDSLTSETYYAAIDCMSPLLLQIKSLVIQVNINISFQIQNSFQFHGCFKILHILPEEVSKMSFSKKAHSTIRYDVLNVDMVDRVQLYFPGNLFFDACDLSSHDVCIVLFKCLVDIVVRTNFYYGNIGCVLRCFCFSATVQQ